ncbi:hypothetical protein SH661x_002100 [Planctomicrobium sp. SH661]|uniref:hypothetical protein n=1 Tax=Planctomicrobium sp. SH661 TaxID=3448124 RepID=UPI003F5BD88B
MTHSPQHFREEVSRIFRKKRRISIHECCPESLMLGDPLQIPSPGPHLARLADIDLPFGGIKQKHVSRQERYNPNLLRKEISAFGNFCSRCKRHRQARIRRLTPPARHESQ